MKKILTLAILLLTSPLFAQSMATNIITVTITLTNSAGTTNGETITINGGFRTWTNNAVFPQTQVPTGTNQTLAASNLFTTIVRYPVLHAFASYPATNVVQLQSYPGQNLSVSVSANWATLSFSTNTLRAATAVLVPKSVFGAYDRTNIASGLVDWLNDPATTNTVSTNAPAFANFLNIGVVIAAFQSCSNYATFFALEQYTNSVTWSLGASNTLFNLINSYNLNSLGSAAFTDISKYQPACDTLSNLCGVNLNGLSYLDGSENIVLVQTNTLSVSPGITRLEAFSEGEFDLYYEDGVEFFNQDTSHDLFFKDHNGAERLEIDDSAVNGGRTVLRSANGGEQAFTIAGDSAGVTTAKPITFNNDTWPTTATGTATNFFDQQQNTGNGSSASIDVVTVPANALTNNGDCITREIVVSLPTTGSGRRIEVSFPGAGDVVDTGSGGFTMASAGFAKISMTITRTGNTSFIWSSSVTVIGPSSILQQISGNTVSTFNAGSGWAANSTFEMTLTTAGGGSSGDLKIMTDRTSFAPAVTWGQLP